MAAKRKRYRRTGKPIEVRDAGGKLFAIMTSDRKCIRIIKDHKYLDVEVQDGELRPLL